MPVAETILIVEDSKEDAELLEATLRRLRISNPIRWVRSAFDAIAYLQNSGPYADRDEFPSAKIILLDLKMPGMDGFDFLQWLRINRRLEEFSIFVVTGLEDIGAIRRAYLSGAKSFIPKPCSAGDFENLIRSFPAHWARVTIPLPATRQEITV
jgi:two-component system response regulator